MNKVFMLVGLLMANAAVAQTTQSTRSSSTTTTTNASSGYNNDNRNNTGTMSTGTSSSGTMGTSGTTGTSGTGTYNSNSSMGTGSTGATGSYNSTGTTGTMNSGSTNGSMNSGTSGGYNSSSNLNSAGTSSYNTTSTSTYNTQTTTRDRKFDYKNFVFGIYAGANTTRFRGEDIDTENPAGRLGYQAGFFVRGGGRLFGQLGAEYFASSSNYFRPGDGQSVQAIRDQINIQYIQVPVYIGYKLTESDRGISAIRVQVGAEYANRISSNSNSFNLTGSEIKSGSFNALGQLGFDIGPLLIDLTYHHGLSDAVQINTFQGSSRRILSASVGFKF
jgi:hypothetical protein